MKAATMMLWLASYGCYGIREIKPMSALATELMLEVAGKNGILGIGGYRPY